MEIIIISSVVLLGSLLTFFSGFGLGTILLPVFCLFFPIEIAVFATAIVHFFNSLFKVILIYRKINYSILIKFGSTAIPFALFGAWVLKQLNTSEFTFHYNFSFYTRDVSLINFSIGFIMISFALIEFFFKNRKASPSAFSLLIGGALSGFFGGFSGHQGAFRAIFLTKTDVSKEEFVATSSSIGFLVDLTRIGVYLSSINIIYNGELSKTLIITILVAFFGSFLGSKLLKKTTIESIQYFVAILLFIMGTLLILGII